MELGLKERLADEAGLLTCLEEVFAGHSVRLVDHEQLKLDVYRLAVEVDGDRRALVAKRSSTEIALRCRRVAQRWLPAAGLADLAPPLVGVSVAKDGDAAWHVYDDLAGGPLSAEQPIADEVKAAVEAIARVHTAFAGHRLLPEIRLFGGDRGMHFYSANLRDALVALRAADLPKDAIPARDELIERIHDLRSQELERARVSAAFACPETLVHGDLWPTNAIVVGDGASAHVRLVDWDEAAAGPGEFDLSTFLLRFEAADRGWILDAYRRAIARLAGWELAPDSELEVIFETAAYARLASLLVWSVTAPYDRDPRWLTGRLVEMVEWLAEVEPVLPGR